MSQVEFEAASFAFAQGRVILEAFSLTIVRGECVALLGRSGSGKTTALKLVNALHYPTSGVVRVDGRPTVAWDPIALRRRTGWVIQEIGLFPHMTVADNVGLVPRLDGSADGLVRARVDELLTLVGLPPGEFGPRFPRQLSGGQRQRVGVARALANQAPLILLDEPFGALDPVTRVELGREFRALQRRLGTTALFVTHDLREAARVADRVALLAGGRLVAVGSYAELTAHGDPEVRAFVEASAA